MRSSFAMGVVTVCLLAGTGAVKADVFNFADEAHRGHLIEVRYIATGRSLRDGEEFAVRGNAREDIPLYFHESSNNEYFLFFGNCDDICAAETDLPRNLNHLQGIALTEGARIFEIECPLRDDMEGEDWSRTLRGRVNFSMDSILALEITWLRYDFVPIPDGDAGDMRTSTTLGDLSVKLQFEGGLAHGGDCRIVDLTYTYARTGEVQSGSHGYHRSDTLFTGTLHQQWECERRPTDYPPPPGTGKPIPSTPNATP